MSRCRWKPARGVLAKKLEDRYNALFGPDLIARLKGPNNCGVYCASCGWQCFGYYHKGKWPGKRRLTVSADRRRAVVMAAARHACGQGAMR